MHDGLDGLAARLLGSAPRFDFGVVFVTTFCDWGRFGGIAIAFEGELFVILRLPMSSLKVICEFLEGSVFYLMY
jgi:hypothetical protein